MTLGSVLAAVSSTSFNKTTPGFWQGQRLPDSDVFPRIDLSVVGSPSTGILDFGGTFGLVPDDVSTFVTTQILAVSEKTGEVTVVEGAGVEPSELGVPAPAGDDYIRPPDFTGTRTESDGTTVQITTKYAGTFADVLLAGAANERHGLARFVALLDDIGGLVDVTEKRTTPGGATFTVQRKEFARDDAPDLAVTVTLPDGYQPIVRQPFAVNLAGHRLGTVQEPIRLVYVDRCIPQRRAVTPPRPRWPGSRPTCRNYATSSTGSRPRKRTPSASSSDASRRRSSLRPRRAAGGAGRPRGLPRRRLATAPGGTLQLRQEIRSRGRVIIDQAVPDTKSGAQHRLICRRARCGAPMA